MFSFLVSPKEFILLNMKRYEEKCNTKLTVKRLMCTLFFSQEEKEKKKSPCSAILHRVNDSEDNTRGIDGDNGAKRHRGGV